MFSSSTTLSSPTLTNPSPSSDSLATAPELQTSPPPPPPPSATIDRPIIDYETLKSTWSHRAWVASGCTTLLISLAKCTISSIGSHIWVQPILAALVGFLLADLASGTYHWAIDNYGSATTPIFGPQIDAFVRHHKWPWVIAKHQFACRTQPFATAITFAVMPLNIACNDPIVHGFVSVFAGFVMVSQQFHIWGHGTRDQLPGLVVALQDVGLLVSRAQHGEHHRPPYNKNYCIIINVWNEVLDHYKVFEALEKFLFVWLGVRPRSWNIESDIQIYFPC